MTYVDSNGPHYVYEFWSGTDCMYVGCTGLLDGRFAAHRRERSWWTDVTHIEINTYPDCVTARDAETALIRSLNPIHNSVYTDHATPRRSGGPTRRANRALRLADVEAAAKAAA